MVAEFHAEKTGGEIASRGSHDTETGGNRWATPRTYGRYGKYPVKSFIASFFMNV